MQLSTYLIREGITDAEFARRIGTSAVNVFRWVKGKSIPDREHMAKILDETDGKVQPNDFYEAA